MTGEKKQGPMLTQRAWRIGGGIALAACALMAWYGPAAGQPGWSLWGMAIYWSIALLFLAAAIYAVLLDIRYIRMQFALERREIFQNTLGSEEFRKELRAAQEEARREKPPEET